MGVSDCEIKVTTKWSSGDVIRPDGDIGQLSINKNSITFHLDGSGDIFARNFVGSGDMNNYKVFTYGQGKPDSSGYFYAVSKAFLYNGSDYKDYSGDKIEGISSFSFEIPELTDWLVIPSVEFGAFDDGTAVICELSTPIIPLKEADPKIYIEYEIKELVSSINNRNEMSLKKVPRVFVEFESPVNDEAVFSNIEILMRFFSLVIGKVSTANDIRMKLDGKDMRMWYFLHHDFSVNSNRNPYCLRYRTKSEDVLELLSLWFRKWYFFSSDESFKFLQDAYFETCTKRVWTIEEIFLVYCRFIEGYDLRISKDEDIANSLYELLIEKLKEEAISDILSPVFKTVESKYKYKEVARWISAGFLGRIGLESRIKRVDERFYCIIATNGSDVLKVDSLQKLYSGIVKTRNYYSHFKPDSTGILNLNEIYHLLPAMNATITTILLSEMGIESDRLKSILVHDDVFWHLVTHLRTEDNGK